MSLKINVGLSKQVGKQDSEFLGATCHVEFELNGEFNDQKFKDATRRAYAACRDAVEAELSKHASNQVPAVAGQQRPATPNHTTNPDSGSSPRGATTNQIRAIHAIASRSGANLQSILKQFNASHPSELSIGNASQVIDQLKNPSGAPAVA